MDSKDWPQVASPKERHLSDNHNDCVVVTDQHQFAHGFVRSGVAFSFYLLGQSLMAENSKAIISLDLACFMSTYMTSLACLLYCRVYNPRLPAKAQWSLG